MTRPITGEILWASLLSVHGAVLVHAVTDPTAAGDVWIPRNALTSHVENGAVNGEAASTINNQVVAVRIM
jgi:hypothetical protein